MSDFFQPNRELLDQERARDAKENVELDGPKPFRLEKGVTEFRVLPPFDDTGKWYREIKEYWVPIDGYNQRFTSPSAFGLPDPIADKRQELMDAGGEANMKIAKGLGERRAFLYNIIVKSAPPGVEFTPGQVYVLKTGVKVKRSLLGSDSDLQGGFADITNPDAGVSFRVTRSGAGLNTDYDVKTCAGRTSLADDLALVGMAMIGAKHLYQLGELYPPKSADELKLDMLGLKPATSIPQAAPQVAQPVAQPTFQGTAPVQTPGPASSPVPNNPIAAPQQVVQDPTQVVEPQPVPPAPLPEIKAPPAIIPTEEEKF